MIELKHVHAGRSGQRLFEDFSWVIREGEHWLITGPNGSGKTSLLELVAGNLSVTHGVVEADFISGTSWDERYQQRKQKIHFIPAHATQALIKQNNELYYQQRYYGIGDERVALVRDILGVKHLALDSLNLPSSFDIDSLLGLEITRLSNGQLKKILLAKILLAGIPKVLLLDYPFEGLDAMSRRDFCDFIDFIATQFGVQIILADHHDELPTVLNRKLSMHAMKVLSLEDYIPAIKPSGRHTMPETVYSNTGDPVVEIKNLRIQYGETIILDDLNWTVRRGERWALIGRNGAGKTTLFSMIFADHPMAYSQEIYLFGRRRGSGESIWDIKKRIGYLGPELMSYLSPDQFTRSARHYLQQVVKPWNDETFTQLSGALDVLTFIDRPMRVLSSGQLQTILIISLLMKDVEMLLLDEPFQFLDVTQKQNLNRYLRAHLRRDQTLILITHYEEDLLTWTDHTKRL